MTNDFNKTENDSTKTRNERFTIQGVGISDHERKRLYDLKTIDGFISIRDLLNELNNENKALKKQLETEHTMLDNAILLERTRMGKNCLKQFREAIK